MEYKTLLELYEKNGLSVSQIANELGCSQNRVNYWMDKYQIKRRSRSDAVYLRHNPDGDPFSIRLIKTKQQAVLFGLGVGLYWGEGTKASPTSVRLGNTDPDLLLTFIRFLNEQCGVPKERLRFGLQLFTDCDQQDAMDFWVRKLKVKPSQFYKITVTISGSIGTYRKKNKYGVVTVYFNNRKLRDILMGYIADIAQG